jgi:hypothetical protein
VTAGQTLDPKAKHSQPLWREARLWSAAKRKLSFCQLRIDGDDEGTLHLDPPAITRRGQSNPAGHGHSEASKAIWGSSTRFIPPFHPRYFDHFSAAH